VIDVADDHDLERLDAGVLNGHGSPALSGFYM
jgi:hypothetical protein